MTMPDLVGISISMLLAAMLLAHFRAHGRHRRAVLSPHTVTQLVVRGLLAFNGSFALLSLALAGLIWLGMPTTVLAAPLLQNSTAGWDNGVAVGAALATGMACIGAGIAVGIAGAAAIGAITEKPESLGRVLIFVGLGEGIAIYGLIISFMILTR